VIEQRTTPEGGSVGPFTEGLGAVLDAVADGITVQDRDGRVVYANAAAAELIGFPDAAALMAAAPGDIVARFELLAEDGSPLPMTALPGREALAGRHPAPLTVRFRIRATGEERWSVVRATPLAGPDGAPTHAINAFQDITGRVLAEREARDAAGRSRQVVESLPVIAWVADASWMPSDRWSVGASYQWNPKLREKDLVSVRARYLLPKDGVVNLSYRFRRDVSEQTDFSFLYPINDTWSVVGRHYYSILDHKPLEQIAGVQWDSCCIAIRLVGRRYVHNREGELSRGILIEVELKGLGSAGQDTRKTLRRAILGYNRGDLYLVPPEQTTGQPPTDPDTQL